MIISLSGDCLADDEIRIEYSVTVLDHEQNEVFQHNFDELDGAISFANDQYQSWDFEQLGKKDSDSGCGTCEAH